MGCSTGAGRRGATDIVSVMSATMMMTALETSTASARDLCDEHDDHVLPRAGCPMCRLEDRDRGDAKSPRKFKTVRSSR